MQNSGRYTFDNRTTRNGRGDKVAKAVKLGSLFFGGGSSTASAPDDNKPASAQSDTSLDNTSSTPVSTTEDKMAD